MTTPLLAAVNSAEVLNLPGAPPPGLNNMRSTDVLVVIAAILFVMTVVVLWAVFIRKPKGDSTRTRIYKSRPTVEETDDGQIRKRKRQKRQRRPHRGRNPTLSEAGGLPPMRTDGSPPPI